MLNLNLDSVCALPIVPIVVPFFWVNQFYIQDPNKVTPKRNYNGDHR